LGSLSQSLPAKLLPPGSEQIMNNDTFNESLVEHGYAVLKQCIASSLISEYQKALIFRLGQILEENSVVPKGDLYLDFLEAIKHVRQFVIQGELMRYIVYKGLHRKKFLQPQVLEKLISALGPDLECELGAEFTINVTDVKDDYLVKKFHQEIWSGQGINTLQTWTPISIEEGMGGIEIIDGSHTWGHIPHRNREPIDIPSDADYRQVEAEEGDMVIFHSLLLHRTVPNQHEFPRFANPQPVWNFHDKDSGFEDLKSWEAFHYSPLSQIRKKLGNPQLSPFRTYDSQRAGSFRQ